jgi:phage FluMu protein Com
MCPYCGQTLGYGSAGTQIEIKCPRKRCKKTINIKIKSDESVEYKVANRE